MSVFARIAVVLNEWRPDIPLLVVEGRGTSDALARLPIDLWGLTNLNRMANTPDPRDFYRVSRAVLEARQRALAGRGTEVGTLDGCRPVRAAFPIPLGLTARQPDSRTQACHRATKRRCVQNILLF